MIHDRALYKSGYRPDYYEGPKIFLNQTGFRPKACVDLEGLYCLNNLHVGRPVLDPDDLYFVAGVLNSSFGGAVYEFLSMERGRAMAQIDIDAVETLPLPAGCSDENDETRRGIVGISRALHGALKEPERELLMDRLNGLVLQAYGIGTDEAEQFDKDRSFG